MLSLVSQPYQFWASYTSNIAYQISAKHLRHQGLLQRLLHGLFDIYFKSINYKVPVEPIDSSQVPQDPAQEPTDPPEVPPK